MTEHEWSHPTMGAWIEIGIYLYYIRYPMTSHPTMGAWIEIKKGYFSLPFPTVAPHDGCVD